MHYFTCLIGLAHIVAFFMPTTFMCSSAAISGNDTDHLALINFKANINHDPLGIFDSWNSSAHFCEWRGVTCSKQHRRVAKLNLWSFGVSGTISPYIGNLTFLRLLNLVSNKFSGEIPPQIGNLHRLRILVLQNNLLSGRIPRNISSCSNLVGVGLSNNFLEGEFPGEMGLLRKLRQLEVGKTNITGSIPQSFGNLSSLEELFAAFNKLTGEIPATLAQLPNLMSLTLSSNNFFGIFPDSFFNITSLRDLDIGINEIHGSLPSDIRLPNIQFFSIGLNRFIGSIPASLSNMTSLQKFLCADNFLTGSIPSLENLNQLQVVSIGGNSLGGYEADDLGFLSSLTNATSLTLLAINFNNFTGNIPETFNNFSRNLTIALFNGNQIRGSIPNEMGSLVSLEVLDVADNALSGTIPLSVGKLQQLTYLELNGNHLSGYVPPVVGNLTNLIVLSLDHNNLSGSIPPDLGNCRKLIQINLGQNQFSGAVPSQIMNISSLSIVLNLANNYLNGFLPSEVESLRSLSRLDVSNNMLSGEIPSGLGSCISLEFLSMSRNLFNGLIPSTLSGLRGLRELDLSCNNLSGNIPEFLGTFSLLKILNLSYNDFSGEVPIEGPFKNVSGTSVIGNIKLCGGIPEMQLMTCDFGTKRQRLTKTMKIIITVISIFLGSVTLVACFFVLRARRKRTEQIVDIQNGLVKVSYRILLRATNEFSADNLIGEGTFGTIYQGVLGEKIVAIKVLKLTQKGASKSFIAECEALRRIKHRNLVKVVTACSGVDFRGNDFKALVYEFMEKGSLEKWLYPASTSIDQPPPGNLNFLQRLNIAIDIACALEYLHHSCDVPVVHCDLKPSNVLLDGDMTAHVGDFGLAKLLSQGCIINSSSQSSSSVGHLGTVGYAPPEYGIGGDASIHGDVYSYGILLLEIFTGKRPTADMFNNGLNLHNFVKTCMPEQVRQIMELILLEDGLSWAETSERNRVLRRARNEEKMLECLVSVFKIGISCSVDAPLERMKMSDVAAGLRSSRSKLLERRV